MTWVKLDDNAPDDPRFMAVSRSARLLHVEALAWSNRHSAGGIIPAATLSRLTDDPDPRAAAGELAEAGIWAMTGDGWRVVWLLDDQPTPEEIDRQRERNRVKQARHRKHVNGDHSACDPRYCKSLRNPVTNRGSNRTPTRPDPSLKGGEGLGEAARPLEGPAAPQAEKRRSMARAIRSAPESLRSRYLATFERTFTAYPSEGRPQRNRRPIHPAMLPILREDGTVPA